MKNPEYYFKDGMRYVTEYEYTHKAYVKKRWIGKTILEVLSLEFKTNTQDYYRKAIKDKNILINNKECFPDDKLKDGMFLIHRETIVEEPVTAKNIEIISEEKDFIVVDKPFGMVVHPAGRYRFNTLTEILKFEKGYVFCSAVNRLDKEVSGLVIISTNKESSNNMRLKMQQNVFKKKYICIVDGLFPEEIICSKSLYFDHQKRIAIVSNTHPSRKEARCVFKRISFNNEQSLVLCFPETGRTHQIRVHLQFLGHPISNDHVYNPKVQKSNLIYLRAICYKDKIENKTYNVPFPDWASSFKNFLNCLK